MCSSIRLNLYYAANSISHSLHYAFHPISILKSISLHYKTAVVHVCQLVINSGLYVHSLQLDYITTECISYQTCHLVFVAGTDLFMDSCNSTVQKNRATGEKGPATEFELGNCALSQSFSYASHQSQSRSSAPNRPLVPVSLSVCHLVQTCSWIVVTPQLRRTGTKGRLGTEDLDRDQWLTRLKLCDKA